MEGLPKFYVVTHLTLQTFCQDCFLLRFVCFVIIITDANVAAGFFIAKYSDANFELIIYGGYFINL